MLPVITISRQFGSGGHEVGEKLAKRLELPFYDKELIALAAKKSGFSEEVFSDVDEKATSSLLYSMVMGSYAFGTRVPGINEMPINDKLFIIQSDIIKKAAAEGPCVIVGRCADYILRDDPRRLSVFVHAPLDERVRRAREEYGVQEPNLESFVLRQDKARASYYNYFATGKWGQSREYDLCVSSHMGIAAAVATIKAAALAVAGGTGA